jgi:hypothetical protein
MSASEQPGDDSPQVVPSSEADVIAEQIERRQARLAADVDELATRVHPKTLVRTTGESARVKARAAVVADDGSPRVERLAAAGSAVLIVVGALLLRGRKRSRS